MADFDDEIENTGPLAPANLPANRNLLAPLNHGGHLAPPNNPDNRHPLAKLDPLALDDRAPPIIQEEEDRAALLIPDQEDGIDLPDPVEATQGPSQRKRLKLESQTNFKLECTGQEVSEKDNVATTYHFKICLLNTPKQPNRESTTYDVEIQQDDFGCAYKKWSKIIKNGLLFCPGGPYNFVELIQRAILAYQERENDEDDDTMEDDMKPKLRLEEETALVIGERTYFISGKNNIYELNPMESPYVKKLDDKERDDLPVKILFYGKERDYGVETKIAMEKFMKLIKLHDKVKRESDKSSFIYSILQNLKAELYPVVEDHRIPIIYSKTTNSGKTVLLLMAGYMCTGEKLPVAGCTESGLRTCLESGKVGRFDEVDLKDVPSITKLQKAIWQSGGGIIYMGKGAIKIKSTIVVANNSTPEEMAKSWKLSHADVTKYDFNHVGETPMELVAEDFQENLDECMILAKELNHYKPVLFGLAYSVLYKRVTGKDLEKYDSMVGCRNQRYTQGLYHLDEFCSKLIDVSRDCHLRHDEIPESLEDPSFSCILRGKHLMSRQSERRPIDMVSEIMRSPEEARKCLFVTVKGRTGIAVWTMKLKESVLYKDWMMQILSKLPDFDSKHASGTGERIRGKLIPKEDIEDIYPLIYDILIISVEKTLEASIAKLKKDRKRALEHLRDDISSTCRKDEAEDDERLSVGGDFEEEEIGDETEDGDDKSYDELIYQKSGFFFCKAETCKKWKCKRQHWATQHYTLKHG